jgi:hypothetical protein
MKYFRIYASNQLEIIGCFPQIQDGVISNNVNDANFIGNLFWEKASENIIVPKPILSRKAKRTDLLSASFAGFSGRLIISTKLKLIIEKFTNYGVQFIKTNLLDSSSAEFDYWVVHPHTPYYEVLNFELSTVNYYNSPFSNVGMPLEIATIDDLERNIQRSKAGHYIRFDRIAFKSTGVDFFAMNYVNQGGVGYYASETLKSEIEKANCTGLVFTGINEKYP